MTGAGGNSKDQFYQPAARKSDRLLGRSNSHFAVKPAFRRVGWTHGPRESFRLSGRFGRAQPAAPRGVVGYGARPDP
jgi:hypothetical protein